MYKIRESFMLKIVPFGCKPKSSLPPLYHFSIFKSNEQYPLLPYYKGKRIYKDRKNFELFVQVFINTLCQNEVFVRNSMKIYNFSKYCLGYFFINKFVI